MFNLSDRLMDEIVNKCLLMFKNLPKNGKPVEKEWTVLSCVVQYDKLTAESEIVSLGTGTKCIGAVRMSPLGDVLNDSHAEVLARRGFLLYLYDNISKTLDNKPSIFTLENCKFKLKENIEFLFYSSQMPCGDASIMAKSLYEVDHGEVVTSCKRKAEEDFSEISEKKPKYDDCNDIHRTGAKCLPDNEQDMKCSGTNYHLLGQVRTKPGRGDRTLSVSCSDKVARWIHLGIQGGLIDMLLAEPIHLRRFIFGGEVPFCKESLKRAFLKRNFETSPVQLENVPQFYQSSIAFPFIKNEINIRAAPGSIIWIKMPNMKSEVSIQGRKQGLTKKQEMLPEKSLSISKYNLFKRFTDILLRHESLQHHLGINNIKDLKYNEAKLKSIRYIEKWKVVREKFFKTWTVKPDIWNFLIK